MPQWDIIQGCIAIFIHTSIYIISFLYFAVVSRMTLLYLLQEIMLPDDANVHDTVYGYLRLSFISVCVRYVFNNISPLLACYNWNTVDEIIIATW